MRRIQLIPTFGHPLWHRWRIASWLPLAGLCLVALLFTIPGITDESRLSLHGDMPRYLMNGVYVLDLFTDRPWSTLLDYTYHYYARYPALSLGHHPPLLAVCEALFYGILGISVFAAKVCIAGFLLLAIIVWFRCLHYLYDVTIAFWAGLLWVTHPAIVHFSRIVLAEIPAVTLTLCTVYYFAKYCNEGKRAAYVMFWLCFFFSLLVKYTAIFMLPICLGYLLSTQGWRALYRRELRLAVLIASACLVLIGVLIAYISSGHLAWITRNVVQGRTAWFKLDDHFIHFWLHPRQLPLFVLSLGALGQALARRDRWALLWLFWIAGFYVQVACLPPGTPVEDLSRYALTLIPAYSALAALTLKTFSHRVGKCGVVLILLGLAGYQGWLSAATPPSYAKGYEEGAQYVVAQGAGTSVLFSSRVDTGYFIFFVRKHDPSRTAIILRADKLLVTSRLDRIVEERIADRTQIYQLLHDFGVGYVVIEDTPYGSPPLAWLREELRSERFILRQRIPISSQDKRLHQVALLIYQYPAATAPKAGAILEMHLPLMGGSIKLPFDGLQPPAIAD